MAPWLRSTEHPRGLGLDSPGEQGLSTPRGRWTPRLRRKRPGPLSHSLSFARPPAAEGFKANDASCIVARTPNTTCRHAARQPSGSEENWVPNSNDLRVCVSIGALLCPPKLEAGRCSRPHPPGASEKLGQTKVKARRASPFTLRSLSAAGPSTATGFWEAQAAISSEDAGSPEPFEIDSWDSNSAACKAGADAGGGLSSPGLKTSARFAWIYVHAHMLLALCISTRPEAIAELKLPVQELPTAGQQRGGPRGAGCWPLRAVPPPPPPLPR